MLINIKINRDINIKRFLGTHAHTHTHLKDITAKWWLLPLFFLGTVSKLHYAVRNVYVENFAQRQNMPQNQNRQLIFRTSTVIYENGCYRCIVHVQVVQKNPLR